MKVLGIPKSFEIMGNKVRVTWENQLTAEAGALGVSRFQQNVIALQAPSEENQISEDALIHTFYHEKAHFLLYFMNNELYSSEPFIDILGNIMYQSDKTAKY